MIIIAANGTIGGVASVASKLTCTMMGMELNGTTQTYKVLYQGQLSNVAGTLYTATANGPTEIQSIHITNTDTAIRTFSLFIGGTANSNCIMYNISLLPGGGCNYEDGLGWNFFTDLGVKITAIGQTHNNNRPYYGITGTIAESYNRNICTEYNSSIPISNMIYLQALWIPAGVTISTISFCSATTAASLPTAWLFGLYDCDRNLVGVTANQTTSAWGANTVKTLSLIKPYPTQYAGIYYCAFLMKASTVITVKGVTKTTFSLSTQYPAISPNCLAMPSSATYFPPYVPVTYVNAGTVWCAVG